MNRSGPATPFEGAHQFTDLHEMDGGFSDKLIVFLRERLPLHQDPEKMISSSKISTPTSNSKRVDRLFHSRV